MSCLEIVIFGCILAFHHHPKPLPLFLHKSYWQLNLFDFNLIRIPPGLIMRVESFSVKLWLSFLPLC